MVVVTGLVGLVEALKESDKKRKTLTHLVRHGIRGIQSLPRAWKRRRVQVHFGQYHADAKARSAHQVMRLLFCARQDWGWIGTSGACAGPPVHEF